MELRTYARVILRYIWVVVVIVGLVTAYSGYQYYKLRKTPGALKAYNSSISLQIGLVATSKGTISPADTLTVASTLADTLATGPILSSREFASDVSHQIGQDMGLIAQRYPNADLGNWQDTGAIASALGATHTDSVVTISVNWNTEAGAWAIANAVGEVGVAHIGQYLDYVVTTDYTHTAVSGDTVQPQVSARVISQASDPATVPGSSANKVTQLVLLILLALAAALALIFLLDYLDDRVRGKEDISTLLQVPIYGEVPRAPTPGHASRTEDKSVVS